MNKELSKKLDKLAESVKELESKVKFLVFCEELRQKRDEQ